MIIFAAYPFVETLFHVLPRRPARGRAPASVLGHVQPFGRLGLRVPHSVAPGRRSPADRAPSAVQNLQLITSSRDLVGLELVRLGVLRADDPAVRATLPVLDRELGVDTPAGEFWHRFNHDGYGETLDGRPFGTNDGLGRLWPIFAGERGEYELAASELSGEVAANRAAAMKRLNAMANTANDGLMLPEQVWDNTAPAATDGNLPGTGTGSATPLGWTHAQFIRLAWSIDAGYPVERPTPVSCHYGGPCSNSAH